MAIKNDMAIKNRERAEDTRTDRQRWMAVLAKAPLDLLEQCAKALGTLPEYDFLRSPEVGLTMVRGRAGGSGDAFNLGEMTLTRCVVQLTAKGNEAKAAGFGYVAGRSHRHAELAALCDALLQQPQWRDRVQTAVLNPLCAQQAQKIREQRQQTAATQVEFFTLRRGE